MIFEERTEIFVHKGKTLRYVASSLIFVGLGIWMFIQPGLQVRLFRLIPVSGKIMGGFTILLFGGMGSIFIRRMMHKLPALVLDERGVYDRTQYASGFDISWSEIEELSVYKMNRQSFITVYLRDPDGFLEKYGTGIRGRMMRMNNKTMGTPLVINPVNLTMKTKELLPLMNGYLDKYRKTSG